MATAAALVSIQCGPPSIRSDQQLAQLLQQANSRDPGTWLRGVGYHPCIAGEIDRHWLDRHIPHRPARIQHRGGRLWVANSMALDALGLPSPDQPAGVEMVDGAATGRLYECDTWVREKLDTGFPDLSPVSHQLASHGITGVTDTTPANGPAQWQFFHRSQQRGTLLQRLRVMGGHSLSRCRETAALTRGEFKIHLLESQLPELDALEGDIAHAHSAHRSIAVHCVTTTELVYALAALRAAGVRPGDRIEHASVTPPDSLADLREMGLRVVTQPHFLSERGDQYLTDVDREEQPWLYRGKGFLDAGIPLAGGSDAPFGNLNPWRAMAAAVSRTTASGAIMNGKECLTPEQALDLYLSDPAAPGVTPRSLAQGHPADLCLLERPWKALKTDLASARVRMTWRDGELIYADTN